MHAGECPESTVGIELGSRLARSIVQVICRISGKMKALSTVLRAPAVVSLIAADAGSRREQEEGGGGDRERAASVSNAIKNHMLKLRPPPSPPLSTHMSSRRFWERIENDIIIISSCKRGILLWPDGAGLICEVLRHVVHTCMFVVTFLTLWTRMVKVKTVGNVCRRRGARSA